ncbi:MAG: alpha/beta fold hydrolase [Candidatus Velthaea sp.]
MPLFKRLLRPLVTGASVLASLAAINKGLRNAPLATNALGGTRRRWIWRGYEIFVTEAGAGPTVLLVHGIYAGASSYEFRLLFERLARTHHVIAFDLLGCGLSDKPNLAYSAELFVEQIVDALGELTTGPAILIGSSLGGAFAIRAAVRAGDRISHLVAICPAGLGGILDESPSAAQSLLVPLIRAPLVGEALFNLLGSRASVGWFMRTQAYGRPASATPEVIDHFYALTHQPGARYVPAYFVGGGLNCNVARDLPFVTAPFLLLWGERASYISPLKNAAEFLALAPHGSLVTFPESGVLPHEEEPDATLSAIERFVSPLRAVS